MLNIFFQWLHNMTSVGTAMFSLRLSLSLSVCLSVSLSLSVCLSVSQSLSSQRSKVIVGVDASTSHLSEQDIASSFLYNRTLGLCDISQPDLSGHKLAKRSELVPE